MPQRALSILSAILLLGIGQPAMGGADTAGLDDAPHGTRAGPETADPGHPADALLAAAERGDLGAVLTLLEQGAPADARNENGNTALHLAAFRGHAQVADALIRGGASVDARDKGELTPLDWAAANGFLAVVDLLLSAGARPDSRDLIGNTPLFWAASHGHLEVVETLLARGASPGDANSDGETPLHAAAQEGDLEICQVLIRGGAAVDPADRLGQTPLQLAAAGGYGDLVALLRANGALSVSLTAPTTPTPGLVSRGDPSAGELASLPSGRVLSRIRKAGRVDIGYRQAAVPFSYLGPDGVPMGYSIDLCREILSHIEAALGGAELPVKWTPVSPETRLTRIARGDIQLECGVTTHTLSRRRLAEFSLTTFVTGTQILVKASSGITGIKDLKGRRVAVLPATTNARAVAAKAKQAGLSLELISVPDHPAGLRSVRSGETDAYAADQILLHGLVQGSPDAQAFRIVGDLLSYDPYAIALPRDDSDFRRLVDGALAGLFRSGAIRDIYRKWLGPLKVPMPALLESAIRLQAVPE